jgi:hypothetical protein
MKTAHAFAKNFTQSLFTLILVLSTQAFALNSNSQFPIGPELDQTPGVVCTTPNEKRYAEQIDYCSRNVSSALKNAIIAKYDAKYGFHIESMNRGDFKIDHFIPLSIGGANEEGNLWPQHKSVYALTDPIELELSILISAGKIKQADAIRAIKEAKTDLSKVDSTMSYLKSLE